MTEDADEPARSSRHEPRSPRPRVPQLLDLAAAWSWRILLVGAVGYLGFRALARLEVVLVPIIAALLLSTVLVPVERAIARRGVRPLAATWLTFLGFLGLLVALVVAIGPAIVDEFDDLDATIDSAADDIEEWLVDGPFGLDAEQVSEWRTQVEDGVAHILDGEGNVADGVVLVGQTVTGILLTLVVTFFVVKDGERIQTWALGLVPERWRRTGRVAAAAGWRTLGAYLRGAALLGTAEAVVMGLTIALVGAGLAIPVAAVTFLAAFVPFIGAIVAGILAVMVALVSGGVPDAAVVAVVALAVQQFDNELLAPWIYGRVLRIHPLVVILSVAGGATIGGLTGAFLAVPLAAVTISVVGALAELARDGELPGYSETG